MRLQVKMLGTTASLNDYEVVEQAKIQRGETPTLYFQLFDADTGNRYMPLAGSTLTMSILRFVELVPTFTGQASPTDFSVVQACAQPFAQDSSIWSTPLTAAQTSQMTSSNVQFNLQEPIVGSMPAAFNTRLATVRYGIRVSGAGQ